jgi:hypothetical protein
MEWSLDGRTICTITNYQEAPWVQTYDVSSGTTLWSGELQQGYNHIFGRTKNLSVSSRRNAIPLLRIQSKSSRLDTLSPRSTHSISHGAFLPPVTAISNISFSPTTRRVFHFHRLRAPHLRKLELGLPVRRRGRLLFPLFLFQRKSLRSLYGE